MYTLKKDSWDDYGFTTYHYIILENFSKKFAIKAINVSEDLKCAYLSVFVSQGEKEEFEEYCQKSNIEYDYIYKNLNLDKYSISNIKEIQENPQHEHYKKFTKSLCRFAETRNYIDQLLSQEISNYIKFTLLDQEYQFDFSQSANYENRSICFIGKNGSRKSTLLKSLFYEYTGYEVPGYKEPIQITADVNGFNQAKTIFFSYGLFDKVEYDAQQGKDFMFDISELIDDKKIVKLLEKYNYSQHYTTIKEKTEHYFDFGDKIEWSSQIEDFKKSYNKLSTGEKYALIFILVLVSEIKKNSLIIIDELEVSQHPQHIIKLQKFLHDITKEFSSYSILATHSPYLVQNIPSQKVMVVKNIDDNLHLEEFPLETFGMSYDEIASIVFEVSEVDKLFFNLVKEMSNTQRKQIIELDTKRKSFVLDILLNDFEEDSDV